MIKALEKNHLIDTIMNMHYYKSIKPLKFYTCSFFLEQKIYTCIIIVDSALYMYNGYI